MAAKFIDFVVSQLVGRTIRSFGWDRHDQWLYDDKYAKKYDDWIAGDIWTKNLMKPRLSVLKTDFWANPYIDQEV